MPPDPVPLPPSKGVVILPPSAIRDGIKREVEKVLATLPKDRGFIADIGISLEGGINAAVAFRSPTNPNNPNSWEWQVGMYIGTEKSFTTNLQSGAYVRLVK